MRMKLKCFLLAIIIMILGAAACAAPESLSATNTPAKTLRDAYSVFIYMCGSDLETEHGSATKNIQEMLNVSVGNGVNIILQTGGARKWRNFGISSTNIQRYEIKSGKLNLLENLPNASMGKARTLADFLCYGIHNYPADKYAVILWDHGSGSIGGVAFDEQYRYDALTLDELQEAFSEACNDMQDKFQLIGLDACLMSTLETAQTLAPYGDYMVASQEITPSDGWDYTALEQSLTKNPGQGGDELGKTICDSYYDKCANQGKDQTVTLSLTELDKIPDLAKSFESFCEYLGDQDDLYDTIRSVEQSLEYGGATKQEGYSNLFDLGDFAENMDAPDVSKKLKEAVVYQRTGEQRAQATGLSIYYPQVYDQMQLKNYLQVCPDAEYKAFLTDTYFNIPQGTFKFLDKGSIDDNGGLAMSLSLDSVKYVSTVEYELTKVGGDGHTIKLGTDNNLYDDWDAGLFKSNFQGYWVSLDGILLQSYPVDETEHSFIYSAPIILNGEETNIRYAFVFDKQNESADDLLEGKYEILGAWSGLDQQTGMSKDKLHPFEAGDKITLLHEGNSGKLEPGEKVIYNGDSSVYDLSMDAGTYEYRYIVTDILGNSYSSNTAIFNVSYTKGDNPTVKLVSIEKSDSQ